MAREQDKNLFALKAQIINNCWFPEVGEKILS